MALVIRGQVTERTTGFEVRLYAKSPSRGCGGAFPVGTFDKWLPQAGRVSACPICTLPAKVVEFPIARAAQKCMPLARGEPEYRA
jgi:hypothetical protein